MSSKMIISALTLAAGVSACSLGSTYIPLPESNFTYPNGYIIKGERVTGKASRTSITPNYGGNAELIREAIQNALSQTNGELLIDGGVETKLTYIPTPIVPIFTVDVIVEGNSARSVVGTQPNKAK